MPAPAPPDPSRLCTGEGGPWGDYARYRRGGDKSGRISPGRSGFPGRRPGLELGGAPEPAGYPQARRV